MIQTTHPLKRVVRRAGIRRARVAAVRVRWERRLLATMRRHDQPLAGRILCYHAVGTPGWGINDMTPSRFQQHMELAQAWGHNFVPASRIARGEGEVGDLAITFDDGVTSVATSAAPIMKSLDIPWTLFVVSDWADGKHGFGEGVIMGWREIERLAADGVEIGSHSVSHPNFGKIPAAQAQWELAESQRVIAARTGIRPNTFAIPMGQSGDWTAAAQAHAGMAGYEFIYAQSFDRRPPGTVPRTFIAGSDSARIFKGALRGVFDQWEEWV